MTRILNSAVNLIVSSVYPVFVDSCTCYIYISIYICIMHHIKRVIYIYIYIEKPPGTLNIWGQPAIDPKIVQNHHFQERDLNKNHILEFFKFCEQSTIGPNMFKIIALYIYIYIRIWWGGVDHPPLGQLCSKPSFLRNVLKQNQHHQHVFFWWTTHNWHQKKIKVIINKNGFIYIYINKTVSELNGRSLSCRLLGRRLVSIRMLQSHYQRLVGSVDTYIFMHILH